jgi:hypothetical protein
MYGRRYPAVPDSPASLILALLPARTLPVQVLEDQIWPQSVAVSLHKPFPGIQSLLAVLFRCPPDWCCQFELRPVPLFQKLARPVNRFKMTC